MMNLGACGGTRRSVFGDVAVLLFLVAQASDGVLTYVGVSIYGVAIEGNPVIGWLMEAMGEGLALTTAKLTAGTLGILLHLSSVHKAVALLTVFYFAAAVFPWLAILVAF